MPAGCQPSWEPLLCFLREIQKVPETLQSSGSSAKGAEILVRTQEPSSPGAEPQQRRAGSCHRQNILSCSPPGVELPLPCPGHTPERAGPLCGRAFLPAGTPDSAGAPGCWLPASPHQPPSCKPWGRAAWSWPCSPATLTVMAAASSWRKIQKSALPARSHFLICPAGPPDRCSSRDLCRLSYVLVCPHRCCQHLRLSDQRRINARGFHIFPCILGSGLQGPVSARPKSPDPGPSAALWTEAWEMLILCSGF